MKAMHNGSTSPGYQNGHRSPMEPEDEFQQNNFNYFEEEDNEQGQGHYERQGGQYYQADGYQQQPVYSPRLEEEEEPPSLSSPRLDAPEGMEDATPVMTHEDSMVREQLGYPLGETGYEEDSAMGGDDAALDLAELEQLQEEAERMKGLGNKHMAAQEYTRAYNAYSAALQLSPVGPSSHVFLSNRAASLLSLKRYSAAAVDARRAVALAPTFGKAHARLGQALYFLKQYQGAIEAYEDALRYEDEGSGSNAAVTRAYLIKAKEKLALQEEKERRRALANGDDVGTVGDESAFQTVAYSVVTDKEGRGVASGMMSSKRLNEVARGEKHKQMSSINEDKEVDNVSPRKSEFANRASPTMMYVETGPMGGPAQRRVEPPQDRGIAVEEDGADEPDPDFDEALRLQRRATQFLSHKKYRQAVDDFSAALFLVPDDPKLTPQLHIGRAHALNGQERFDSAKNDALMALRHILRNGEEDASAAEAYSVLGKSLYYTKDYHGAIEALEECDRVWKLNGGKLSVFDEAYLEQCHEALDAGLGTDHDGVSVGGGASVISNGVKSVVSTLKEGKPLTNIPKLKPPRFVSREQALQNAHNIPPMPKNWPMQSPTSPSSIATGPERVVTFLSDAMGIKLNRGNDGLIRVISVADLPPGSPILRKGKIETGDLVREAGGVDLRRPITATMWGDTVALIKMAPRPLTVIVAKEMTSVFNGSPKVTQQKIFDYPSPAIGEDSVNDWEDTKKQINAIPLSDAEPAADGEIEDEGNINVGETDVDENAGENVEAKDDPICNLEVQHSHEEKMSSTTVDESQQEGLEAQEEVHHEMSDNKADDARVEEMPEVKPDEIVATDVIEGDHQTQLDEDAPILIRSSDAEDDSHVVSSKNDKGISSSGLLPDEASIALASSDNETIPLSLKREILFDDSIISIHALDDGSNEVKVKSQGWANKRWAAVLPSLQFSGRVFRLFQEKKMFWCTESFAERTLAIFKIMRPDSTSSGSDIILILRDPIDVAEVHRLLPNAQDSALSTQDISSLASRFFVAESAIDPMTCKLRLSQLTTPTSIPLDHSPNKKGDNSRQSIFDLLTPSGSISLSAVQILEKGDKQKEQVHHDVDVIVETTRVEDSISNSLFSAHSLAGRDDAAGTHQVVLGTLHSYVISGNDKMLQDALTAALQIQRLSAADVRENVKLDSSIIDSRDTNWKTGLHYACERGKASTISLLINAGANCMTSTHDARTPLHLCAERLDDKCLSIILSATHPARPDPNALDSLGRTPMYLAAMQGNDAAALARCLSALDAWGGQFFPVQDIDGSKELMHPVYCASAEWRHEQLGIILTHVSCHFPLTNSEFGGISLGAKYGYPIHTAVISLRQLMHSAFNNKCTFKASKTFIANTIQTLVEHGFEPNERFEGIVGECDEAKRLGQYFGFTPLQILAAISSELKSMNTQKQGGDSKAVHFTESVKEMILSASDVLIRSGARMNLPLPPITRLDRETPPGCISLCEALELCKDVDLPIIDRKGLKLDEESITSLFGGKERVKASLTSFSVIPKPTNSTLPRALNVQLDLSSVADSTDPGGSDSNSCAICWSEFGVISNRKQFCHVSTRYVCNDCSSKRLVESGRDVRVSDGQFFLAKSQESKRVLNKGSSQQAQPAAKKVEPNREFKNRLSLGLFNKSSSSDNDANAEQSTKDKITSTVSSLHQTRNAVLERGSKLEGLADKTEALSQASLDFANMAKELNQQQSSWW